MSEVVSKFYIAGLQLPDIAMSRRKLASVVRPYLKVPMKLPRVRIQSLPAYTAEKPPSSPTGRNTPTIAAVKAGYAEADQPTVFRAMAEALIYNLSFIQGEGGPSVSMPNCEQLAMVRNLGRNLWSWSSIEQPYFEEGLTVMASRALRSSSLLPEDMRALSPRFAALLLLTSFSNVERDIGRALACVGIEPKTKLQLAFALSCLDYGTALLPFSRVEPLPVRAGYSNLHSAVLAISDNGNLPFSHYILTRGLYEEDQAKRLREMEGQVYSDLGELAGHITQPRFALEDVHELADLLLNPPSQRYAEAVDAVMTGKWSDLILGPSPRDPDEDLLTLMARAIIRRLGCEGRGRWISAAHLLGLSLLTGISPASFARHALADFSRRGTTYLTAATLDELADLVDEVQVSGNREAARRDVLSRELRSLADSLGLVHSQRRDWEVALPQRLVKCRVSTGLAFEWTARLSDEELQ